MVPPARLRLDLLDEFDDEGGEGGERELPDEQAGIPWRPAVDRTALSRSAQQRVSLSGAAPDRDVSRMSVAM
jgi:hypothetical protein